MQSRELRHDGSTGPWLEAPGRPRPTRPAAAATWTVFVVVALVLLDALDPMVYGVTVPIGAAALALSTSRMGWTIPAITRRPWHVDRRDLAAVGGSYVVIVALFRAAFDVFTTERVAGLFLSFSAALLIGVAGPVVYTVWLRHRPLASLGIGPHDLGATVRLGLLFAGVQFTITLWGYDLPQPVDWVPLLIMTLAVGLFEAIFFRGFIQTRLEASFGAGPAVLGAAALYALYHVGYGMGASEMVFLFGLGVAYGVAFRLSQNVLVLWPLLIPLGSFFAQLEDGNLVGELPWASVAGFADVLVAMAVIVWLAARFERRRADGRGRDQVPPTHLPRVGTMGLRRGGPR